ncbi:hypothetical protein OCU04_010556 [Sclerotinia nivalis]|uniref:HORMA domain-containing protein n=1 Tax=Sclerotinia nivalis TaxID=352851 RepID=A0A9X0DGT5_9HELO|nr:hypothetical protein OCU04_010556 [Sclerotinia nivalis]
MPTRSPPLGTPHSLHTHLLSFLTLSIHTILHARGLYPKNTFLLTRAFNFPVPQNRHPQLCAYINSCITSLTPHLQSGSINTVSIVIYSDTTPSLEILERYIFNLSSFPSIPPSERFTNFEFRGINEKNEIKNIDVEEELRATLRKLSYSAEKLEDLKNPEECTWGLVMELKEDEDGEGNAPISHPQVWEPAVPELQVRRGDVKGEGMVRDSALEAGMEGKKEKKESRVGKARGGVKSTAIRAVEVGEFIMEAWIEEGKRNSRIKT